MSYRLNRSAAYWSTRTVEVENEMIWKQLGHTAMHEMGMKTMLCAMIDILKPLDGCKTAGFEVSGDAGEKQMCFAILLSESFDYSRGKYTSGVKHGLEMSRPCVRCIATATDILKLKDLE